MLARFTTPRAPEAPFHLFLARGMIPWSLVGEVREAKGEARMEWVTPGHEEVDLSCEVSGYANAEL